MFKNFIYFLIFIFTFGLTSCKKKNDHKIKFEVEFIEGCQDGYSNFIDVRCKPQYSDEEPTIPTSVIVPGYVWEYEYWKLRDGDNVEFLVSPQQGYHFIMRVYVDGNLVSYREIQGHYGGYYAVSVLDEWGINNATEDMGLIKFVYSE